jgi:hypothetical protein
MVKRAPAPPYLGEGPPALWHVSEEPTIARFAPHRVPTALTDEPLVWAVDTRHLPLYWFPRDCPRCTFWAGSRTNAADVERFLDGRRELRVHVIEEGWLERVRGTRLYVYRLPIESFTEDGEVGGYWVSRAVVDPLDLVEVDDLIGRHAAAGIVLRTTANLWPLWDAVVGSTLEFSGIRLRNALSRPQPSAS